MHRAHKVCAAAPKPVSPDSEEAAALAGEEGYNGNLATDNDHLAGIARRTVQLVECESYADACMRRVQANLAQQGELTEMFAYLCGEMAYGARCLIEKALKGRA